MTLEALIGSLNHDEKLLAMEILWRDSADAAQFKPLAWHGQIIQERLAHSSEEHASSLEEVKAEVLARLHEDRT